MDCDCFVLICFTICKVSVIYKVISIFLLSFKSFKVCISISKSLIHSCEGEGLILCVTHTHTRAHACEHTHTHPVIPAPSLLHRFARCHCLWLWVYFWASSSSLWPAYPFANTTLPCECSYYPPSEVRQCQLPAFVPLLQDCIDSAGSLPLHINLKTGLLLSENDQLGLWLWCYSLCLWQGCSDDKLGPS